VPLAGDRDLQIGFTVATGNRWGIAVSKANGELRGRLDNALEQVAADGRLEGVWTRWMPTLPYPFSAGEG
jgi:polar amino acid transport system substrate-binding protein